MLKKAGLDVLLCDSGNYSRLLTETLHPGIEPLLELLGITNRFRAAGFSRHGGYVVASASGSSFQSYGQDWLGYQIDRHRLREILWERAGELGVPILIPVRANNIIVKNNAVRGVRTSSGDFAADFVVDATGCARFLCCRLRLDVVQCSRKLVVQYGYGEAKRNDSIQLPRFETAGGTWRWTAAIDHHRLHWARLLREEDTVSHRLIPQDVGPVDSPRLYAADATWRAVVPTAVNGFFAVGDAAGTIDPAAGNGVIRAIMSSIMASHLICQIIKKRISLSEGAALYSAWFNQLYIAQCNDLSTRYLQMGIDVGYASSVSIKPPSFEAAPLT